MKRFWAFVLTLFFVFSLTACKNEESPLPTGDNTIAPSTAELNTHCNGTNTTTYDTEPKHTGKKIGGEITGASVFSEGLAFVCTNNIKDKTYCINKDGYIVFELDYRIVNAMGKIESRFKNGFALVGDGICDTNGNVVMPEDVGATLFCDIALEDGYIIAERITSDFNSSKKELGVMNTKFEWIVAPSEELYNSTGGIAMIPSNTRCFYHKDYFYSESTNKYLNLKSGEVFDSMGSFPSKQWINSSNSFYDYNKNKMLDLTIYQTIDIPSGSNFVNGNAPVRFINHETNKYYFTLINEKGDFLFEPVETISFQNFVFDGKHILILDQAINPKNIKCYNTEGRLLGEINAESIAKSSSFSCDVSNDVILLIGGRNFKYTCYYFNSNSTELF